MLPKIKTQYLYYNGVSSIVIIFVYIKVLIKQNYGLKNNIILKTNNSDEFGQKLTIYDLQYIINSAYCVCSENI